MKICFTTLAIIFLLISCQEREKEYHAGEIQNVWHDIPALNDDGSINILIEIPAGSNKKYELDKTTGELVWETLETGEHRTIHYLPYPANYGMIPQTYLPEEFGGDGDPLDVIVLGEAIDRGKLISCKLIGVLRLNDRGENDDKLIAVSSGSPFYNVPDIEELEEQYPGVLEIINLWFSNYKGRNKITTNGFLSKEKADSILQESMSYYNQFF